MRRIVLLAVAGLLVAFASGCGSGRVPTYPVSGRLAINGKPPAEGWVAVLHLESTPASIKDYPHPLPRAKVGPDGRFQFRTYEQDDGAPAGKYKISFINVKEMEAGASAADEGDVPNSAARPAKEQRKSPQVYWPEAIEIRPEPNELPPFDLKR
jgi:hypothetical protein